MKLEVEMGVVEVVTIVLAAITGTWLVQEES